jgi:chromosome segregation ATPase
MTLDDIPDQFKQLVGLARDAIDREIGQAKKTAAAANAEKSAAQAARAELQERRASAQKQLDAVNNELGRALTLAGLNREITEARKTLETLKAEKADEEKAVVALKKQRTEGEAKLVALGNEAQRQLAIRREAEAAYADIKARVYSVQLGQRT